MMLELAVGTGSVVELGDRCSAPVIATNQFVMIGGAPDVLVFQGFGTGVHGIFFTDAPTTVIKVSSSVERSGVGNGFGL